MTKFFFCFGSRLELWWVRAHQNMARKKLAKNMHLMLRLPEKAKMAVFQLYLALRFFLADQPNIGLSVDASRIGNRNRMLGFITRPDGYGAWLPPQAFQRIISKKPMYPICFRFFSNQNSKCFYIHIGNFKQYIKKAWLPSFFFCCLFVHPDQQIN